MTDLLIDGRRVGGNGDAFEIIDPTTGNWEQKPSSRSPPLGMFTGTSVSESSLGGIRRRTEWV
jgi:hypothetical protein